MATLPPRKPPAAAAHAEATDLLQILVFRKALTREQAERVRRHARASGVAVLSTIIKLGLASEVQIGDALAAFAGLRFIKINPLELDLDVVTGALSGPFARKHGLVAIAKTAEKLTVAVHDPFASFPTDDIKRVTGLLAIERVVATRSDIEAINKHFYDLKSTLQTAEKQPTAEEATALGIPPAELLRRTIRRGTGCLHCRQTSYVGRDGVFQVMPMSERLRGIIARQNSSRISSTPRGPRACVSCATPRSRRFWRARPRSPRSCASPGRDRAN